MKNNTISIVIGSWGSYNACNDRALGSTWLDLSDYEDWDEIVAELKKQGFKLNGIDEELFIQDIEGLSDSGVNWDYMHPERLFNTLKESGVLDEEYKFKILDAYLEVRSFKEFEELVEKYGENWDDDINIYEGYDWDDYGRDALANSGYDIPDFIEDYIDFESYGESCGVDCVERYSGGLIEIYR